MITMSHGGLYIKGYKTWGLRNLLEIDLYYNTNTTKTILTVIYSNIPPQSDR